VARKEIRTADIVTNATSVVSTLTGKV